VRSPVLTAPSTKMLRHVVLQKLIGVSEALTTGITRTSTSETSVNFYQTT
jgi:hypothetical protein